MVHSALKNYTFSEFGLNIQIVSQPLIFTAFQKLQHQKPGTRVLIWTLSLRFVTMSKLCSEPPQLPFLKPKTQTPP